MQTAGVAPGALKSRWRSIGTVFIAVGIALNLPIGILMIVNGETARGFLQLCVAAALTASGLDFRRRATRDT